MDLTPRRKASYSTPLSRLTEWEPEESILSHSSDFYPFEDEDYSEGGEYRW